MLRVTADVKKYRKIGDDSSDTMTIECDSEYFQINKLISIKKRE